MLLHLLLLGDSPGSYRGGVLLDVVDKFPLFILGVIVDHVNPFAFGRTGDARDAPGISRSERRSGGRLTRRRQELLNHIRGLIVACSAGAPRGWLARHPWNSGQSLESGLSRNEGLARLWRRSRLSRDDRLFWSAGLSRLTWLLAGLRWILRLLRLGLIRRQIGIRIARLAAISRAATRGCDAIARPSQRHIQWIGRLRVGIIRIDRLV